MGYSKKNGDSARASDLQDAPAGLRESNELIELLGQLARKAVTKRLVSAERIQARDASCRFVHAGCEFHLVCSPVDALGRLSKLERRFAELAAKGYANKEIATATQRSVGTVKSTLKTVYLKLRVPRRVYLARWFSTK